MGKWIPGNGLGLRGTALVVLDLLRDLPGGLNKGQILLNTGRFSVQSGQIVSSQWPRPSDIKGSGALRICIEDSDAEHFRPPHGSLNRCSFPENPHQD